MPRNREVLINTGGIEIETAVDRGYPQRGVLCSALFVDSLIRCLNNLGYYTIRYADDIVILLTGKIADTLCEIMQAAVTIVEEWCSKHTLSVNGDKTKPIQLTRRRKIDTLQMGVVLDWRLNWKKHVDDKVQKARSAFW